MEGGIAFLGAVSVDEVARECSSEPIIVKIDAQLSVDNRGR